MWRGLLVLQGAVAVAAAEDRFFDGYVLNEANAHAIAVSISNLYSLTEENATCDWNIKTVEECSAVIAISMGAAWTPTSINSQHFPAGCFLATSIDDQAAFFNFHSNAVNTDQHRHQSLCRTGALLSDVSAASFCETTSVEVAATSEADCVTSCASDASCKGIKYNRGSSKCQLLSTQTFSFVGNSSDSLHCIKTTSCLRSDLAVIDEVVSLDSCFQNPRLNPSVDAQEACFDIGCGAMRTYDPDAPVTPCQGQWSNYSACTTSCGPGQQYQTFAVTVPASNGGIDCADEDGQIGYRGCTVMDCPVDCVGDWSAWGGCSASCGGGSQSRAFVVSEPVFAGGEECNFADGHKQFQNCGSQSCPTTPAPPTSVDTSMPSTTEVYLETTMAARLGTKALLVSRGRD